MLVNSEALTALMLMSYFKVILCIHPKCAFLTKNTKQDKYAALVSPVSLYKLIT